MQHWLLVWELNSLAYVACLKDPATVQSDADICNSPLAL